MAAAATTTAVPSLCTLDDLVLPLPTGMRSQFIEDVAWDVAHDCPLVLLRRMAAPSKDSPGHLRTKLVHVAVSLRNSGGPVEHQIDFSDLLRLHGSGVEFSVSLRGLATGYLIFMRVVFMGGRDNRDFCQLRYVGPEFEPRATAEMKFRFGGARANMFIAESGEIIAAACGYNSVLVRRYGLIEDKFVLLCDELNEHHAFTLEPEPAIQTSAFEFHEVLALSGTEARVLAQPRASRHRSAIACDLTNPKPEPMLPGLRGARFPRHDSRAMLLTSDPSHHYQRSDNYVECTQRHYLTLANGGQRDLCVLKDRVGLFHGAELVLQWPENPPALPGRNDRPEREFDVSRASVRAVRCHGDLIVVGWETNSAGVGGDDAAANVIAYPPGTVHVTTLLPEVQAWSRTRHRATTRGFRRAVRAVLQLRCCAGEATPWEMLPNELMEALISNAWARWGRGHQELLGAA